MYRHATRPTPADSFAPGPWQREAVARFALAVVTGSLHSADRWREAATARGLAAARVRRRQRLWTALAGPGVPRRIACEPAPRLFRAADVPSDPAANAHWYRAMSALAEHLRRGFVEPHVAELVLDLGSAHAVRLYRALGGARGIRRGLAAFVAWCAAHPDAVSSAGGEAACAAFLAWLTDLRRRPWFVLPSGNTPVDWMGLTLPREARIFAGPCDDLSFAGARGRPLRTAGEALDWFEAMGRGEAAWLAQAEHGIALLFAFETPEGAHTLVVCDSFEEEGWLLEHLAARGGAEASDGAWERAERWLEAAREQLPPAAFAPSERDTN
ncbi:MAG: hypothetical protein ACOX6T_21620 [Myxococcales bacterium]|jgi:hypothetical protein